MGDLPRWTTQAAVSSSQRLGAPHVAVRGFQGREADREVLVKWCVTVCLYIINLYLYLYYLWVFI